MAVSVLAGHPPITHWSCFPSALARTVFCFAAWIFVLGLSAQAQQIVEAEYFINADPGIGRATPISFASGEKVAANFDADVASLPDGFHRLFVRARDDNGRWGFSHTHRFFVMSDDLASRTINSLEYFIGTDPGRGRATPISFSPSRDVTTSFTVDLASLEDGLHRLFVRGRDGAGRWSLAHTRPFFKLSDAAPPTIQRVEYFVGSDPGKGQGTGIPLSSNGAYEIVADLSSLPAGLHRLYVRAQDANGAWSLLHVRSFYRLPSLSSPALARAEYFIGTDPGRGQGTPISLNRGRAAPVVNLTNLPVGMHRLYVRAQRADGTWSMLHARPFLKIDLDVSPQITRVEYYLDEEPGEGNGTEIPLPMLAETVTLDAVIDLTDVPDGDHVLNIRAQDDRGSWSDVLIHEFVVGIAFRAVSPERGGNIGTVTLTLSGQGFAQGSVVRLEGPSTLTTQQTVTAFSQETIQATFNLSGAATGLYDVVLTYDGGVQRLADAFTIEAGRLPSLAVEVIGRDEIRRIRPQTFDIQWTNEGNIDAYMTPLFIAFDDHVEYELPDGLVDLYEAPGQPLPGIGGSPEFSSGDTTVVALVIPLVRAGETGRVRIELSARENFSLSAWSSPPFYLNLGEGLVAGENVAAITNALLEASNAKSESDWASSVECATLYASAALGTYGATIGGGCALVASSFVLDIANATVSASSSIQDPDDNGVASLGSYFLAVTTGFLGTVVCATEQVITPLGLATRMLSAAAGFFSARAYQQRCLPRDEPGGRDILTVGAIDPNEKVGPPGFGDGRFTRGERPFSYIIYFENLPDATAPAQEVFITDTLDVETLDLSTFSIGRIQWSTDQEVTPPPGLSYYTTLVDLRPEKDLLVRVTAELNEITGIARWTFRSLDPDTQELPEDPFAGFLPPNTTSPEGEGSVQFTIAPRPGLSTDTRIENQARIVFDLNEPIDTPVWTNTIDNSPPSSAVTALSETTEETEFSVSWEGNDAGAGIAGYSIFVSTNDGPFEPWLVNTTETTSVYSGERGNVYGFYSVALDGGGNREAAPAVADAETGVIPVELTTFNAATTTDGIRLSWTTASETNNAGFAVERRIGDDAFARLSFVTGAGTTTEVQSYTFLDRDLPFDADEAVYRLRQTDLDGGESFSEEVAVRVNLPTKLVFHSPFPNPARSKATLRYELPAPAHVKLVAYNVLGQQVAVLVDSPEKAGRKELSFDGHRFASGLYVLRLHVDDTVMTQKVVLVR